ncbi:MAG: putative DNA binding domain-containing protein [Flavobacteriales bacterium]|nr:putative DNA binding domain-containing protein [Flavobacteriales bacterium]
MNITIDGILKAASIGEGDDWEFKSAKGGLPGSLWSTYSGMANTEGGTIVLGVSETNGVAKADGLQLAHAQHLQKELWDLLHNRNKVNLNLLSPDDMQVVTSGASAFVVMRVPRATRTQRPIYTGNTPLGNTWRRYHEGDYKCSDAEVRRMLADAEDIRPDQRILEGFTVDDLDIGTVEQYRQRFRAAKPDHPWLSLQTKELLEQLGGWRKDRESSQEGLTVAGLLMFGKDNSIREPGATPNYFVDYREKLDPAIRWTDRIFPDGTWQANLFQFYHRVWPRLAAGLPTPFKLEGSVRKDDSPAHEALREAFVNALVHADYLGEGGIVIERYPDRFVFNNPGILLVSLEQFRKGGVSEGRNKQLQKMFLMLGIGEQAGSGVERIRAGWREKHWRVPFINIRSKPDRVLLTLPMVSLIPPDTLASLKRSYGTDIDRLKPAELQAMATAELEGSVSNGRLQELVGDHPFDITKALRHLCEMGMLISDNKRRWTTYRLPDSGGDIPDSDAPHRQSTSLLSSDYQPINPSPSLRDLPDSTGNMPDKGSRIADKSPRRTRVDPETTKKQILELCQARFLTAKEMAQQLAKNDRYLSNNFIYPLVREGLLRPRFPGSRRKDQAYTTATQ